MWSMKKEREGEEQSDLERVTSNGRNAEKVVFTIKLPLTINQQVLEFCFKENQMLLVKENRTPHPFHRRIQPAPPH